MGTEGGQREEGMKREKGVRIKLITQVWTVRNEEKGKSYREKGVDE